jgi:hypothetical protein
MRHLLPKSLVLILSFAAAAPALAVYKCRTGDKTLYSDLPCPGGSKLVAIDKTHVAAADAAEARARNAREKALVGGIDKQHARDDAAHEKQVRTAYRTEQAKKSRCATLARRAKWAEEDARTASSRSAEKARTKSRRAAEQFDALCKS